MNTGIGDAVNLAWKLGDVLRGRAAPALLASYEPERIAFARRLVATTDRAFVIATSSGRLARFVRVQVVPRVLSRLVRSKTVRRFMFRALSQTALSYRGTGLGAGRLGDVHGGDRLPWVELEGRAAAPDNFAVLDGLSWQVHVYGVAPPGLQTTCAELGLPLHVFAWGGAMGHAGLTENGLYLVRPDGHVAWAAPSTHTEALTRYLATVIGWRAELTT
jgi:hypothetical protein